MTTSSIGSMPAPPVSVINDSKTSSSKADRLYTKEPSASSIDTSDAQNVDSSTQPLQQASSPAAKPPTEGESVSEATNLDELFLNVLREQIERDRTQTASSAIEKIPDFVVPFGKEKLFNAPLNKALLQRDYAIWKRVLGISRFIFTQSALQFQGLSKGSMLLGAATGAFLTKYFPLASVVGLSGYAGYKALVNLGSTFFGSNSRQERSEIWNSASFQSSSFDALSRRITSFVGMDSLLSRLKNAVWGVAQAYLVTIGYNILFQRESDSWASAAAQTFKLAQDWVLPIPAAIAAGGIGYFGMMLAWSMNARGNQKLQDQFEGFAEDFSYNGEYRRLLYLSDQEYQKVFLKALNVRSFAELEEKREEYANQIRERMRTKKYLGANQVLIDANASLKELNPSQPHQSLKSVLAQYHVLTKQKEESLKQYQSLTMQHEYSQAHVFLNTHLKPLLLKIEFLKQTLLDPTRPPLGILSQDGSEYYSYVSILSGVEIKEKITLTDPKELEAFFSNLLINETAIHKYLCFEQGIMQVDPGYLQRLVEEMKN